MSDKMKLRLNDYCNDILSFKKPLANTKVNFRQQLSKRGVELLVQSAQSLGRAPKNQLERTGYRVNSTNG